MLIMSDKSDKMIHEKSKERVSQLGEVFTPAHIVQKMCDMVPQSAWKDPSYIFLEPTCGNGNFIVAIFQKRLDSGLSVNKALNTLWGMDIMQDNIHDCHVRLCKMIVQKMKLSKKGGPGSVWWNEHMCRYVAIIENNIFRVDDSLEFMESGKFDAKKFVFEDPNDGEDNVLSSREQDIIEKKILTRYNRLCSNASSTKNNDDIVSLFL